MRVRALPKSKGGDRTVVSSWSRAVLQSGEEYTPSSAVSQILYGSRALLDRVVEETWRARD